MQSLWSLKINKSVALTSTQHKQAIGDLFCNIMLLDMIMFGLFSNCMYCGAIMCYGTRKTCGLRKRSRQQTSLKVVCSIENIMYFINLHKNYYVTNI